MGFSSDSFLTSREAKLFYAEFLRARSFFFVSGTGIHRRFRHALIPFLAAAATVLLFSFLIES